MKLAIGIYAKDQHRDLGGDLNKFTDLDYVLDLPIGHYCYSGDDKRNEFGFKYQQDYYVNSNDVEIKAVTKKFQEIETEVNGKVKLELKVTFDYYDWPIYNESGDFVSQEVGAIKEVTRKFSDKQLFNRRRKQREYSIQDLESLGFKFEEYGEAYPTVYPQLIGYQSKMALIFKTFQLEIGSFISTKSDDFKNGILSSLSGGSLELIEALNTLVPTIGPDGSPTLIETWKGIYARL